jgi:hypothetical protein
MISKSVDILFMKSSQLHVVSDSMRTAESEIRLPVSQHISPSFSEARNRRGAAVWLEKTTVVFLKLGWKCLIDCVCC